LFKILFGVEVENMDVTSAEKKALIMIVDDQHFMRKFIRDALNKDEYDVIEAKNGKEAVSLFRKLKPEMVLMDGEMPVLDGFSASRQIRESETGERTVILMITALDDADSIDAGFKAGVNDFIQKPVNLDILNRRIALMLKEKNNEEKLRQSEERFRKMAETSKDCILLLQLEPVIKYEYISPVIKTIVGYEADELYANPELIEEITHKNDKHLISLIKSGQVNFDLPVEIQLIHKQGHKVFSENYIVPVYNKDKQMVGMQIISRDITQRKEDEARQRNELTQKVLFKTVTALSATIETRDPYTSGHQQRVAQLAVAISQELGLDLKIVEGIHTAALLHDIGKIKIPAEYLSRPGRLSGVELNVIKTHAEVGYEILNPIEFPWPVATIVLQHHERINGTGYPYGLLGDQLLLETKIIAVADVVEAMASHRPYRVALGIDEALHEISNNMNSLYDEEVVKACLKVFEQNHFTF
jgi:putative nucleotidyltransferase with HDIG domain/PAS domain S-box-containing protein